MFTCDNRDYYLNQMWVVIVKLNIICRCIDGNFRMSSSSALIHLLLKCLRHQCLAAEVILCMTLCIQCLKLGHIFSGLMYKLLLSFIVKVPLFPNKTIFTKYSVTWWISKLPRTKTVRTCKILRVWWEIKSKRTCLQNQAKIHRSRALQIVIIFNTVHVCCVYWFRYCGVWHE